VLPQSAALNRELEAGAIFCRAVFVFEQERAVDQFNKDASVLNGLDGVCDLHQLLRGGVRIGESAVRQSVQKSAWFSTNLRST
jgi:hypothetical protein